MLGPGRTQWGRHRFGTVTIVPFPINFPELYRYYLPLDATFFLTIYDDWGEKKLAMFQALGLKIEVLWRRTPEQKGLTASEVRKRMVEEEKWQQMVPPAVAELLLQWHAAERLRKLAQQRIVATRRRG